MFGLDARAADSIKRASKALGALPSDVAVDVDGNKWLKPAIREAARYYWADVDDDSAATIGDVKEEMSNLLRLGGQLAMSIKTLEPNTRRMLAFELQRSRNDFSGDVFEAVRSALDEMHAAGSRLTKPTYAREAAEAKVGLCSTLWTIRERAVGRRFSRTYDTNKDVIRDQGEVGFNHPDSMFVFELMRAIDPKISLEQVEHTLRQVAKVKDEAVASTDDDDWVE